LPALAPTLIATLLLASAPDADRSALRAGTQLAQVTIEQRVIIRIPVVQARGPQRQSAREDATTASPPPPPRLLREVDGPRCLALARIRGAIISPNNDIVMVSGRREQFRPHFSRACRAVDFYAGFYIEPAEDGALCARRDELHARNGSSCAIERFSRLVPVDPEP